MRNTLLQIWKVVLSIVTLACIIVGIIYGHRAYFVHSVDAHGTPIMDGLGRPLFPSPWFFRYVLGADAHWAGAKWFWRENLIFWTTTILLFALHGITNLYLATKSEANKQGLGVTKRAGGPQNALD